MPSLPRLAAVAAAVLMSTTVTVGSSAAATDPARATSAVLAAASSDVATGLQVPWAMVPLADGAALVTERNTGRIYRVKPGTPKQLYTTVPGVVASGEGGLLGIALSQGFPKDRRYFVYYTTAHDNRVAMMLAGSTAAPRPIVTTIRKAGNHNGGGLLVMGNDLYIGTGDAGDTTLPQYSSSLNGKVLRVRYDGTPSAGNRWGKVFTMGHRNVQGLTPAPDGRTVYATRAGSERPGRGELDPVGWPELRLAELRGSLHRPQVHQPDPDLADVGGLAVRHQLGRIRQREDVLRRRPARHAAVEDEDRRQPGRQPAEHRAGNLRSDPRRDGPHRRIALDHHQQQRRRGPRDSVRSCPLSRVA